MTDSLILDALQIRLGGRLLVDLNIEVPPGEVATIMGPSGSGKSTALAAITGTLPPAFAMSGRVLLGGTDISALPTRMRRIGLLFQDPVLFPHMSVGANLAFALPPDAGPRALRRERVATALAAAGLAGLEERDPDTLSGGQKARVALLRTLLAEPRALLLDEPFSRLDADLRAQIRSFTFDSARRAGIPTLLVTHDAEDAHAGGGPVVDTFGRQPPAPAG